METMTVEEVIRTTADNILGKIRVPAELAEEIGMPIYYAIRNLHECLAAYQQEKEKGRGADEDPLKPQAKAETEG